MLCFWISTWSLDRGLFTMALHLWKSHLLSMRKVKVACKHLMRWSILRWGGMVSKYSKLVVVENLIEVKTSWRGIDDKKRIIVLNGIQLILFGHYTGGSGRLQLRKLCGWCLNLFANVLSYYWNIFVWKGMPGVQHVTIVSRPCIRCLVSFENFGS